MLGYWIKLTRNAFPINGLMLLDPLFEDSKISFIYLFCF